MGKPKQATTRYRRSKGKGRALQLQAARLKRNIHQLVENSSEVADESFDLEQVQQQRFDEGQHTKRLGSTRDSVRKANCRRSQQHRMEKVRRATQEERRRQEQAEDDTSRPFAFESRKRDLGTGGLSQRYDAMCSWHEERIGLLRPSDWPSVAPHVHPVSGYCHLATLRLSAHAHCACPLSPSPYLLLSRDEG
ncbi:hypothetical protein ACOMHN_024921 [Nucella lapillus]